jgi:hypothetical protein
MKIQQTNASELFSFRATSTLGIAPQFVVAAGRSDAVSFRSQQWFGYFRAATRLLAVRPEGGLFVWSWIFANM